MKDYIKPTFTLAGLFPVALAASCAISEDEADYLENFMGVTDWSKAFFDAKDGCEDATGIDGYCKFAYAEDNNYNYSKILNSF